MSVLARSWFVGVAVLVGLANFAAAEETPAALALVVPDSLAGWMHGETHPTGWTADGQRLRGCAGSSPLVSAWTFGDFTLELTWSSIDDGALEVLLPTSPVGDLLTIALNANEAGRIIDGDKQIAAGRKLAGDGAHRCRIERAGERLTVTIDDEKTSEAPLADDRRVGLSLNVSRGVVAIDSITVREPRGEPIFNGTDLTGWNTLQKENVWVVEEGELVTAPKGGEYLRSDKEYENFILTYDYRTSRGGNSGLGFRTPPEKWPSGAGMELQMLDVPGRENGSQMSIYRHLPPLARPDVSEAWNHVVVKCDGPIVTAWVNGQIAQHRDLDQYPSLAKKPRRGWLGFQHHGSKTHVKNVYLFELPSSTPPAAEGEAPAAQP